MAISPEDKLNKVVEKGKVIQARITERVRPIRLEQVRCRLTVSEKREVEAAADRMGVSVSNFIRLTLREALRNHTKLI